MVRGGHMIDDSLILALTLVHYRDFAAQKPILLQG
jgi:hypothetical protein